MFNIGIGGKTSRAYTKHGRNKYWKNTVNKHGYEVEILCEDLTWEQACEAEIHLIAFYGRSDLGLGPLVNMTDGGEGMQNLSPETREKLKKIAQNRIPSESCIKLFRQFAEDNKIPIIQYTKSGEYVQRFNAIVEASDYLNINTTGISSCCMGKTKSAGGYVWRYEGIDRWFEPVWFDKRDTEEYKLKVDRTYKDIFKDKNDEEKRPVDQYSLDGKFIKHWDYITQAVAELQIRPKHINECCKSKKGRKSAGGYLWRHSEYEGTVEYINHKNSKGIIETRKKKLMVLVIQMTKSLEFIKEWPCAEEAGRVLGISTTTIRGCCNKDKNRKTSGGFKWKYKYGDLCRGRSARKVTLQLDLKGNVLKEWPSGRQASIELNIHNSQIGKCCKGEYKTAGGFKWKYKE